MAPKKGQKMDLGSFLADETFGSWADDEVDVGTLSIPARGSAAASGPSAGAGFGSMRGGFDDRPERREYPIPDQPPYRVRLNNLPWDGTEEEVLEWLVEALHMDKPEEQFESLSFPTDQQNPGKLRNFGFITFSTRELLEEALKLSGENFLGRKIYVSVAAPEEERFRGGRRDEQQQSFDWRGAKGSADVPERRGGFRDGPREPRAPREDGPEPDWNIRGQAPPLRGDRPMRESREPREPREPREELPEPDWNIRGQAPPARAERAERPLRRVSREPEPELDWSARGSATPSAADKPLRRREPREPREPREQIPEPEWNIRGQAPPVRQQRDRPDRPERTERPKREEPQLDWSSARGAAPAPRERKFREKKQTAAEPVKWTRGAAVEPKAAAAAAPEKKDGPKRSAFEVLAVEDDDEDVQQVTKEVEGWDVVGKKK